jgi:hypothetical protein
MKTSKNTESTTNNPAKDADCEIDIKIESRGGASIYHCTVPAASSQPCRVGTSMKILTKTAICFLVLFTATVAHAAASPDCAVPSAHPDGDLDETRIEIQKALDNQGCADLGPGVYNIGTKSGDEADGLAGITTLAMKDGRSLRGTGPRTVLKFTGKVKHGDWNGIRMSGTNVLVSDLLIETSGLTNTSEQAHAIQVQGNPSTIIGTTKGARV